MAQVVLVSKQEKLEPCSDLHKPVLTPLEDKGTASLKSFNPDMDKITHFGVAKPCKGSPLRRIAS
jgi:hypothetical protein